MSLATLVAGGDLPIHYTDNILFTLRELMPNAEKMIILNYGIQAYLYDFGTHWNPMGLPGVSGAA